MSWEKKKKLLEEIAALRTEAEGLVNKASDDNRELTAEEDTRFSDIEKEITKKQGLVDRAERVGAGKSSPIPENRVASLSGDPGDDDDGPPEKPKTTHAVAIRHSRLKAFATNEEAYRAGQFYAAVLFHHRGAQTWCQERGIDIGNAMLGSNTPVLVPNEVEQAIIDVREAHGAIRNYARIIPMSSNTKDVPVKKGGLTAHWVGQGVLIPDSDAAWEVINLVAQKLAALSYYSSELDEDSIIDLGDTLSDDIGNAFSQTEDRAAFLGDGTAEFGSIEGIIPALESVFGADEGGRVVSLAGETTPATLTMGSFTKTVGRLPNFVGIQPAWFLHKSLWAQSMLHLQATAGGNTMLTLANGSQVPEFLGFPVVFVNSLPSGLEPGEPAKIVFGDLRLALVVGSRRGIRVELSEHYRFAEDLITIKGTQRIAMELASAIMGTPTDPETGSVVLLTLAGS